MRRAVLSVFQVSQLTNCSSVSFQGTHRVVHLLLIISFSSLLTSLEFLLPHSERLYLPQTRHLCKQHGQLPVVPMQDILYQLLQRQQELRELRELRVVQALRAVQVLRVVQALRAVQAQVPSRLRKESQSRRCQQLQLQRFLCQ